MAEQQLKLKIGADVNEAVNGVKKLNASIETLRAKLEARKQFLLTETDVTKIAKYNREIDHLKGQIIQIQTIGTPAFGKLGGAGSDAANKIAQSFTNAFSAVRTAANILPGIGIAGLIGIFSEGITNLASNLFKLREATDSFKVSKEALDEAMGSTEYIKASTSINELRINVQLAKEGLLDKKEVLKQYNDSIGKTTGQVKTLDEAEQSLVKNGPAYLKMILFQAAAHIALEKAAKKAVDAEIDFQDNMRKAASINRSGEAQKDIAAGAGGLSEFLSRGVKNEAASAKKASDERVKALNDVAEKFQRDAAEISKGFKFDFFGGKMDEKAPKEIKAKIKKIKIEPREVLLPLDKVDRIEVPSRLGSVKLPKVALDIPVDIKLKLQNIEKLKQQKEEFEDLINGVLTSVINSGLGNIGEAIGAAIGAGTNPIIAAGQSILGTIGDLITQIGKALIEYGIVKEGLDKIFVGGILIPGVAAIVAGVAAVAAGTLIKSAFKPKRFAEGGLAFGPTLGLVGEGRGTTRSNPEVIAPLDKLKKFIGGGNQQQVFIPAVEIGYDKLRLAFNRANDQGRRFQ